MITSIKNTIIKENLINENDNILIALSGGPDSVFLFHILRLLKDSLSFNIYASHINHMYRGIDANHDEKFVEDLCNRYNIKLFVKRKNATEYAKELKMTEEEAGRKLRYDFFSENLTNIGGGKIAVAHNLNDQSETVLQRIIRGTGVDGLSAMSYKNGNIIRPIIDINKRDIIGFLNDNKYEYCKDYTNDLPIYGRNKIRLNLIPYLEENFNPNIQNVLFRMSKVMNSDSKIIKKHMQILYNESVKQVNSDEVVLDLNYLKSLDENELGRVIRIAIKSLKGNTNNIENKHIQKCIKLIESSITGKQINISDGIIVSISYNDINFRKGIEKKLNFEYNISIGDATYIEEVGKTVLLSIKNLNNYIKKENEFYVDYDKINGQIKVRNRKNSDSMIPFGMSGRKKLKNIFIDNKVPANMRDKMLILEDSDRIFWLENYRISETYRVSISTKKILAIKIMEDEDGQLCKKSTF
ncbi:tRNA lysidine(34) synthetase TilS [Sedimentibacter sp. zth1]|uniref:tRNA lysidine(34) synthetase TilS n=1 Tax=Sedimentibacter sp. zth1 TaxID=2816908 RepID=UPI001A9159DA|nr:tRNA lysidine(34) synthetase TilS [Sedimentibacter sp. zth1]QSX05501.1 tRNA lysidine(34) synthetase TilS [Sedimentibacter sp. zth1]